MNLKSPYTSIAVFGDAEEACSPTTRLVPRHKTKPCRKLTPISERGGIVGRRDKRGGSQGADPFDALELPACFTLFAEPFDPLVINANPVVSHDKLVVKVSNERSDQWIERDLVGPIGFWQAPPQGSKDPNDNDAELCTKAADFLFG